MNCSVQRHRRSSRTDVRPALLWFSLTALLLSGLCAGMLFVRVAAGDWLDLKMESARVRVLEMLPKPAQPDFVPTPLTSNVRAAARPTILWSANVAARAKTATAAPTATVFAAPTARREEISGAAAAPTKPPTTRPTRQPTISPTITPSLATNDALKPIQTSVQLSGVTHEAQRFNNCGPTTLRMYFSYYGYRQDSQVAIANVLKPNKDDRNVSPDELVGYAQRKGFRAMTRVNGDLERLKLFLSNEIPVMIEEGYDPPRAHQGWMGHYLLLTGYDENGIIAQDSYNGPNQHVTWQDLDANWRNFNRTYLLVYTDAQAHAVNAIVGKDMDDATMYA